LICGSLYGFNDLRIGRAATEIAAHPFSDFGLTPSVPLMNASNSRHDLTRCAEAALKGVLINECLLNRVEGLAVCKTLNGRYFSTIDGSSEDHASVNPPAIQMNRAGPALAIVAALLGTRELQPLTQEVQQRNARIQT
jgi:hypothetical protein